MIARESMSAGVGADQRQLDAGQVFQHFRRDVVD
jgi:hypothetical protein